jgi:Xaa-Pro dipeptidase
MSIAAVRRRRLVAAMEEAGLDLILLYGNAWQNDYLRYAADFGIQEGEGLALVTKDGEAVLWLDDPVEAERASVECTDARVELVPDIVAAANAALARAGNRRIAAGPARHLPHGIAAGPGDATAVLDRLLMVKAADELAAARRAADLADRGYEVFRKAALAGRADYELVAEIEAYFRAHGVQDNFMIIGVGGPEVRGMAPPQGKRLKPGDMVTTELTPCVDGYYTQICRTLVVGGPNEAQRTAHAIWRAAMEAGIDAARPGATAADIARAENDVFRAHGLGDYVTSEYTRVRGHGVGLFPDTKPHILEDVDTPIEAGMSLVVHPNTFNPHVGYMVLGDSLIVTETGPEVLTRTPREIFAGG